MATSTSGSSRTVGGEQSRLTIREAVELLSREERFMATVAAMNTLLIAKGVYKQAEFDEIFCQWAEAQQSKPKIARVGKIS